MDIESMPKLSKSEIKKVFQILNSQEEAEDLTLPKESTPQVVDLCNTSGIYKCIHI